jgi:glycine/D-amino acid oxidase-like deaminating enzyme
MAHPPRRIIHAPNVNARPTGTGGLLLEHQDMAETIAFDTITDPPPPGAVELLRRARRLVPGLDNIGLRGADICIRPLPADGYPIVGWSPEIDGCYVAVTHSGVTLAPYLAKLVANEVLDDADEPMLAPYGPQRSRQPGQS